MKSIAQFIKEKPKKKFSTIHSQASQLQLNYCLPFAESHWRVYSSSKTFNNFDNISYISCAIHLPDVFIKESLDECFVYYYENNDYRFRKLYKKIIIDILNGKAIFLNVDITGYGYNEDSEEDYHSHGISIILQPGKECYKGVLINSHGNCTSHEVDVVLSNSRVKTTIYKEGIDVALMRKLLVHINGHIGKHNKEHKEHNIQTIEYYGTKNDTYLGVNLQGGDWRGFCYMYPFIIFHYYGFYYNESRKVDDFEIESSSELLKKGHIIKFVHGIFANFNKRFKEKVIEIKNSENKKYIEELEIIIEKQGHRFIKDIISPYLSFLNQKTFKKDNVY